MRFAGIPLLGALGHLLVSGLLALLAFVTAMTAFNMTEYVGLSQMFILLLKIWNLPVCLFDYFFTSSPKQREMRGQS